MSDWADELASRLDTCTSKCYCEHITIDDGLCSMCLIAAALREAVELGRREERWACHQFARRCMEERLAQLDTMDRRGNVDAVEGKQSEALRIADAIAARGPMRKPEEEE